ncbi:MAG TPA: ATP-binding protein, partial [Steroidobacteraceae bacterium]|nr:ATP-binding protein [Steroidobacteraceae bacterium]
MSDTTSPEQPVRSSEVRAPAYIGPLIPPELWPLRYAAALSVVAVTVALRTGLAPLLGTQAPLLPFVLAVFVSAYVGGRGPALLASFLTPLAATFWFTAWPHDAPPMQWGAHVAFFLLIAGLATIVMHELQRSSLAQLTALRAAAQSEGQMRESAAQLRLIADAMPALISYIAPDGTYRFTNKLYQSWFGKAPEEVAGRHVRDVLGREAFEVVRPRLERALQGTRVFFEQTIPYASGPREVAVHYIPDIGTDGAVRGCFALIEDISARKRAERALREVDRRKDDFLAILGHELRNPLAPIRNVAHILSRSSVDAETVRRSGELLERQANHLTHLVDDLLDVGRITRGRVALDRGPLLLSSVVDTAIETTRSSLEAKRQAVTVWCAEPSLSVDADSVRLCQVVANLLNNASKYSPEGARIEVRLEAAAGEAVLTVRDQGAGIDPQLLPRIFDQFLQGDRSLDRTDGGLGIGLTVVKHLVEMHGGRVEAKSAGLGRGSEFRVHLPRVEPPPEVLPGAPHDAKRAAVKRRVLVVDDNRDAAESLREVLRMSGHEVAVVNDGAGALSKLDEFRADIVLLDIGLPRMDGYMVAHAIRARFSHPLPRPRLVALTG